MAELRVDCPAKVNLFLEVLGKRSDGYHEVITVMQCVELHDRLFFRDNKNSIIIRCSESAVPTDERNLIFKAVQLLLNETRTERGVEVEIDKRIPVASGMGGASSNAAGTLIGLNRLWNLGLTREHLLNLSRKVGTDVAFFIHLSKDDCSGFSGGTLLGKGTGNELTELPALPTSWLILISPAIPVSTKWVYGNLDLELTREKRDSKMIVEALRTGDVELISKCLFNRLEEVAVPKYPVIGRIKTQLLQEGIMGTSMTGSGPVVFGFAPDRSRAREIAERISTRRKEEKIYVTRTV